MRLVIAIGGNALLQRGQAMSSGNQLANIRIAAAQIARVAAKHQVVLTHGNGPQVGLLALQSDAYHGVAPYPLDVLGAESEGMIGYLLEQEIANLLGPKRSVTTLLSRVEVDAADPAFAHPSKPIGPQYSAQEAAELVRTRGWSMALDGSTMRRVVASPQPVRVLGMDSIRTLMERGVLVIATGGGGIPVVRTGSGHQMAGIDAVIDKDLCSVLLATGLEVDALVIATDVDAVYIHWGAPEQQALGPVSPKELAQYDFAQGSMAPKVLAACRFANATGKSTYIGALGQIEAMLDGLAGTRVRVG
jgi:carbamate kinase